MSSDNAALLKALEQWIKATSARHPSEADKREALRLVSRAKWARKALGPHKDESRHLKLLESQVTRALKDPGER